MAKFKGFEKEDGSIVKVAYLNGYAFGDRLLEGVMFKVQVTTAGDLEVEPCKSAISYLQDIGTARWVKEAKRFAESTDCFQETEKGGEDLMLLES